MGVLLRTVFVHSMLGAALRAPQKFMGVGTTLVMEGDVELRQYIDLRECSEANSLSRAARPDGSPRQLDRVKTGRSRLFHTFPTVPRVRRGHCATTIKR